MKVSMRKRIKQIVSILLMWTASVYNIAFAADGSATSFFNDANAFFAVYITEGGVDYQALKDNGSSLKKLAISMATMDLNGLSKNERKAFWINAYNLTVINSIVQSWPVKSPMDVGGFFDQKKHIIANQKLTINDIENKKIRAVYNDPRIHFVLVCAAMGCPKVISSAYLPDKLEAQLEARTRRTLNDPSFIRIDGGGKKVLISEIFKWYKADFTGTGKSVLAYINQYRKNKVPADYSLGHYTYDWSLNKKKRVISPQPKAQAQPPKTTEVKTEPVLKNTKPAPAPKENMPAGESQSKVAVEEAAPVSKDSPPPMAETNDAPKEIAVPVIEGNPMPVEKTASSVEEEVKTTGDDQPLSEEQPVNLQEYTPSALLKKGQIEVKIFNNLYTDKASFDEAGATIESSRRQNYFSGFLQTSYGIGPKLNIGLDAILKSVRLDEVNSSPFALFSFQNTENTRTALSYIGPKIKVSPFKKLKGLSIQSTFFIPVASDQQGERNNKPYLSFDGYQWWIQVYYDQQISEVFRAFFELDAISYIDRKLKSENTFIDTPVKAFLSYFPTNKITLYALTEWAPSWGESGISSYYSQVGVGGKYQLTHNLEIELLYTDFPFGKNKGAGTTYNLGLRFLR